MFDAASGDELFALPGNSPGSLIAICHVSPDGTRLASNHLSDARLYEAFEQAEDAQVVRQVRMAAWLADWHRAQALIAFGGRDWAAALNHLRRVAPE